MSRTQYAELFSVIGSNFGDGDGTESFHLPDLRGRFLRGTDNGTKRDPDAASRTMSAPGGNTGDKVGTAQDHVFASHVHGVNDPGHSHSYLTPLRIGDSDRGSGSSTWSVDDSGAYATAGSTTGISIQSTGGTETRPINISVNYIIKF